MNVNVLIISHTGVGRALAQTAFDILGKEFPIKITNAEVELTTDPDEILPDLLIALDELDEGAGVLILTDLLGATPSNTAIKLAQAAKNQTQVVSGINLAMLLSVLNYYQHDLNTLAQHAYEGGQQGIVIKTGYLQ